MLLLKLVSELQNLFNNTQSALVIWIKCRLNFHEVEWTGGSFTKPTKFSLNDSETVKVVNLGFCSIQ